MTLGGLVVALGVVVDDAVIDVENILRRRRSADRHADIGELFLGASLEVRRPVFYATAAVAVAFLPILTMSGLQGAFFRPLSIAFLLAVGLSLLVAMSATPALCALVMAQHEPKSEAGISATAEARPIARRRMAQPEAADADCHRPGQRRCRNRLPAAVGCAAIARFPGKLPDCTCLAASRNFVDRNHPYRSDRSPRGLSRIPGVKSVAEQIGRAENGQDPDAPNKSEFEVQIDPQHGRTAGEIDAPSGMSSTIFRTSSWRSIRCWRNASARRFRASRRPSPSV